METRAEGERYEVRKYLICGIIRCLTLGERTRVCLGACVDLVLRLMALWQAQGQIKW